MRIHESIKQYAVPHPLNKNLMGDNITEGAYKIPYRNYFIFVVASSGMGWDHVSVSLSTKNRCPNWDEMCFIKDLFFDDEETVIQFHPKKSKYINVTCYVLHLWKQQGIDHQLPEDCMV